MFYYAIEHYRFNGIFSGFLSYNEARTSKCMTSTTSRALPLRVSFRIGFY